jgi:hypothetical protein
MLKPMPSPNGTNREQLYILRGGRGGPNPRGAYDGRRGLAYDTLGASPNDNVAQIINWAKENMSSDEIRRLAQALGVYAQQNEAIPAADDAPSVDPMQTRGRAPGARVGMDAAAMKSLNERFGLDRIGWA